MTVNKIYELKDVWVKGKNGTYILQSISFTINEGEMVALIGRNGAGKTTLMKVMTGVIKPTKGEVKLLGKDVRIWGDSIFMKVGFVLQNPDHQLFSFSVREELEFVKNNYKLNVDVNSFLKKFNLLHLSNRHPFWLSEGEKKKLCILSILIYNPPILILDEPFSTLDWFERREMLKLITHLNKEGKTILLSTHDLNLIRHFKKVIVMEKGRIKRIGSYEEAMEVFGK